MTSLCNLLFSSFNTKGMGQELKRKKIFMWARDKNVDVLMLQETHSERSMERIWTSQWAGSHAIFAHGATNARGVCILMNKGLKIETEMQSTDEDGRWIVWKGKLQESNFFIMNIYAPNQTCEQVKFLKQTYDLLVEHYDPDYQLVLGGDFNVVFDPKMDKKGGSFSNRRNVVQMIKNIASDYGLIDAWRTKNPYKHQYTWEQNSPPVKCRLDYFLMSTDLLQVTTYCSIAPDAPGSDHKALMLKLQGDKFVVRGPGLWKLNNQVLMEQPFADIVRQAIDKTYDCDDSQMRWDMIKHLIGANTRKYCAKRAKESRKYEESLKKQLDRLEHELEQLSDSGKQQYQTVKNAVSEIYDRKAQGAILRSRARWMVQGEKNTKYFLGLEKRNYNQLCINQLDLGSYRTTNPVEIQTELHRYYSQLVKSQKPDLNDPDIQAFFSGPNIPRLDSESAALLDEPITLEECQQALAAMKQDKTPGSDGLTVEFYKLHWDQIKEPLYQCFLEAQAKGYMSLSQTHGVIRLIPKPGKNPLLIANWRPITLLNVDYKILSAVLARRLRSVLDFLIHEDQTGFMAGRNISENTRLLLDLMSDLEEKQEGAFLISVDIHKAFDSLEWTFMERALSTFGIGSRFIQWIKTLYAKANRCVINNGYTTETFEMTRGTSQGDCASPFVFVLCIELLSIALRNAENIHGIRRGQFEYKVTQYADDTTLVLADEASVSAAAKILLHFGKCSGLQVSPQKTVATGIGAWKNRTLSLNFVVNEDEPHSTVTVKPQTVKVLGIQLSTNKEALITMNLDPKWDAMATTLKGWHARGLTLQGRIIALKSLGISQLVYPLMNLAVYPEDLRKIDILNFGFIWGGRKKQKIRRSVMIQDYANGGLKAPCIYSMYSAWKVKWLQRVLNSENAKWAHFGHAKFSKVGGLEYLLKCDYDVRKLPVKLNSFYSDLLTVWRNANKHNSPENRAEVEAQLLNNNKHLLIGKKSVYIAELCDKHIDRLNQWLNHRGEFFSYQEMRNRYNVSFDVLRYNQIISAIPQDWKRVIRASSRTGDIQYTNELVYLRNVKDTLIWQQFTQPNACTKWLDDIGLSPDDWYRMCLHARQTISESKLYVFQFKLLHRILCTGALLKRYGIRTSEACHVCAQNDTLVHALLWCQSSSQYWRNVYKEIEKREPDAAGLLTESGREKHVLFGLQVSASNSKLKLVQKLNFIMLWSRYFLYLQRVQLITGEISIVGLLAFIQFKLKTVLVSKVFNSERDQVKNDFSSWL